jgi:hypothetical protein
MLEPLKGKIASAALKAQNRRQHSRHPFTATVEAVESASQTRIQGRISDLSGGGCYVDTISSFPAGSKVSIRVTRDTHSFETRAQVVYSLIGMGMGLKFTGTDPEQQQIVNTWLAEIGGETMAASPAPVQPTPAAVPGNPGLEEIEVLNELVALLKQQGLLSVAKSEAMLAKLARARVVKLNPSQL